MSDRERAVLLVDDDEVGRQLCALVLEAAGFHVAQASDGARAVAAAVAHPPDIIVTDLEMPVMNGIEAIARLKTDKRTTRGIPIVVLTAGNAGRQAFAMQAGASLCLVKPCSPDELEAVVRSLLPMSSGGSSPPPAAGDQGPALDCAGAGNADPRSTHARGVLGRARRYVSSHMSGLASRVARRRRPKCVVVLDDWLW